MELPLIRAKGFAPSQHDAPVASHLMQPQIGWNEPPGVYRNPLPEPSYQVEYATLINQPMLNPALVGLVPPEPATWTKTERIDRMVS